MVDLEGGADHLADLVAGLCSLLFNHIDHEEHEGLPLIDATVAPEVWQAFTAEHGKRIGPDARRYFPWVFGGAQPLVAESALSRLPPPVRQAFHSEWEPAYRRFTIWPRSVIEPWGTRPA